jgi:DNA-binding NtrC family response regulator
VTVDTCKVLVIDDDANCARELCLFLAAAGFSVQSELDAFSGISRFLSDPEICIVVSEIRMPDCNGMDLVRFIRQSSVRGACATFILLTWHPEEHTALDALKLGVSAVFLKPLDRLKIFHAVSRAVDFHLLSKIVDLPPPQPENAESNSTGNPGQADKLPVKDILAALKQIMREKEGA